MANKATIRLGTNYNQLFTVEEAFVRLGQNRLSGELLVLNKQGSVEVFVEDGFVVAAYGLDRTGIEAFEQSLDLPASNYVWVAGSEPLTKEIHLDIREYLLRRSLTRDVAPVSATISAQKRETLLLPKTEKNKDVKLEAEPDVDLMDAGFFLVPENDSTARIVLTKTVNLVGREIYCDVVLPDVRVSRKHCLLQLTKRGVMVRDLDSCNGTFVNGKVVGDAYLKVCDRLSVGGYGLILKRDQPEKIVVRTGQKTQFKLELTSSK